MNCVEQLAIVELMCKIERLELKNRDAQALITTLKERLMLVQDSKVEVNQELAKLKQDLAKLQDDDAQVLIVALTQRLKKEQDTKAEFKQKLADVTMLHRQKIADLDKLRRADRAEITKLKNRFNKRKVAAEIADLEKQVVILKMEKSMRDKNRLLALQRHVQRNQACMKCCTACGK